MAEGEERFEHESTEADLELGDRYGVGGEGSGGGGGGSRRGLYLVAIVAVIVAVLAGWWLLRGRGGEEAEPVAVEEPPPATQAAPAAEEPVEEEPLPPLDASDRYVAERAGELSSRPELARWLTTENLARRFVAAADNVSRGVSPRPNLPALVTGGYRVEEVDGTVHGDPAGYRRYDTVAGIFASLDVDGAARLYRRLSPLFDQAYRDLGYPDADFDDTLRRAIDHLLAAPVPPASPVLEPVGGGGYAYADPDLEALSPAQKHLLRAGPDNVRKIQTQLRALRAALRL